ncbi:radical SAM protein [Lachnospiraceae bacterium C1.1]|nr:radical SAM protein [Lachnospiraceae bacterium C1.1]
MGSYLKRVFRPCIREYLFNTPGKKRIGDLFKLFMGLVKPDALIYPDIVCELTTHCSLKCAHCNNLMYCYDKPYHVPADEVIADVENMLSHTDFCVKLTLLGGEPFVYPELAKVVKAFQNHEKIYCLTFVTNGTVIPSEDLINLIAASKNPKMVISDYGQKAQKVKELSDLCKAKGIHCELGRATSWVDPGGTDNRGKSVEQLSREYNGCFSARYCRTLLKGKIYTCARAASLVDLGYMDGEHDSFDTRKPRTEKEFRRELREFLTLDYADACNYCDHAKKIVIPAGEQVVENK